MMPNELGPRATQRFALEQARKLAEAVREEARADDPITPDEALYRRLVAPRKLESVVELRRSKPVAHSLTGAPDLTCSKSVRDRDREQAAAGSESSACGKWSSALVSAANHTFWITVLAILVVTASPLE
jgi:hypothetical protein